MGAQIPIWVTVLLAFLVPVGTVGGALGGQLVSGRNDKLRSQRERDQNREAHWRDKRLEVYSVITATARDALGGLRDKAAGRERGKGETPLPLSLEQLKAELATVDMVGSDEVVRMCFSMRAKLLVADLSIGLSTEEEVKASISEASTFFDRLRLQMRRDLGVSPEPAD